MQAVQQGRRVLPLDQLPEIRRRDAGPEPQPDARPRTGVQHVPRLILPGGQAEILPRPRPVRMGLEQQAVPGVEQFEQKAQADPPVRGVSLSQPGRRVFRQAVPQKNVRPRHPGQPRGSAGLERGGHQGGDPHLGTHPRPRSLPQKFVDHLAPGD